MPIVNKLKAKIFKSNIYQQKYTKLLIIIALYFSLITKTVTQKCFQDSYQQNHHKFKYNLPINHHLLNQDQTIMILLIFIIIYFQFKTLFTIQWYQNPQTFYYMTEDCIYKLTQIYEIGSVIGHGTTCTVRKAIKRETREVYAIKFYLNQKLKGKNQMEHLMSLDHPSIVNIYDYYEQQDSICLVLQYMAGGELYNSIGQKKHYLESQVKNYMRVIIDAVRYCHQMRIVHRDIKPQNILLTNSGPTGILKIADFGISKIISDYNLNTCCGTPIYMAPEIWAGKQYNEKVDIWSMGVVMYLLLSGCYPFDGDIDDTQKLKEKILHTQLKFQENIWNRISSRAILMLKSMLQINPNQRSSAQELTKHIWLTQVQTIYRSLSSDDENSTTASIQLQTTKMRKIIHKNRLKKQNKQVKALAFPEIKKLSKVRKRFLVLPDQIGMVDELQTTQEES